MKDQDHKPEGHQPPPEKPNKHEKHRRRGVPGGLILLIILALLVAAAVILWQNGFFGFGKGSGDGDGEGSGSAIVSNVNDNSAAGDSSEAESTVVEIKVDNEKIFLDGAEVANAAELKDKITEIGDKKTYNFVHDTAIKATYDEVKAVLSDLERALNIKVNYNDNN